MSFYALPGPLCSARLQEYNKSGTTQSITIEKQDASPLYRPDESELCFEYAKAMAKRSSNGSPINTPPASPTIESKPRVILDFSKLEKDTDLALCHDRSPGCYQKSYSNYHDFGGVIHSDDSITKVEQEQYLKIQVKDCRFNFYKLARPQRASERASISRSSRRRTWSRLHRRQEVSRLSESTSSTTGSQMEPHENAIEFELVISYAGRTYSAKRTLQQLVQLRADLIEELIIEQKWTERKYRTASSFFLEDSCRSASSSFSEDDDTTSSISESLRSLTFSSSRSMEDIIYIPELPRMSDDTMGVFGSGFTVMSGMLHAYRPLLEQWFLTVMNYVSDDSPVLADFLWEPLSAKRLECPTVFLPKDDDDDEDLKLAGSDLTSNLGSIQE